MTNQFICFGEVLWDSLPDGLFLGGAPLNVAYHLHALHEKVLMVSSVGDDYLGEEVLERMKHWGMSTDFVFKHPELKTGVTKVQIQSSKDAVYDIVHPSAWDEIFLTTEHESELKDSKCLIYGSLALRDKNNQNLFNRLFIHHHFKVCDVNLRKPYDLSSHVLNYAKYAQMIKLNIDELYQLIGMDIDSVKLIDAIQVLEKKIQVSKFIVTFGEKGAGFYDQGEWFFQEQQKVNVVNTVGAGDAFLAAFLSCYLKDPQNPQTALQKGCERGGFVAGFSSATPS